MKTKHLLIFGIVGSAFIFSFVTVFLFKSETQARRLPYFGKVSAFSLKDTEGKTFGSDDLDNKVWVTSFIFTTCGDICPKMTKNMASLHRSYLLEKDVSFVSISVNPEQDGPEVLKQYAKMNNADTSRWHFLTGPRASIRELTLNSFKLGSMEEPIFHSSKFVLVDRNAYIRGYYEGTQRKEINQLFKDIAMLRKER